MSNVYSSVLFCINIVFVGDMVTTGSVIQHSSDMHKVCVGGREHLHIPYNVECWSVRGIRYFLYSCLSQWLFIY